VGVACVACVRLETALNALEFPGEKCVLYLLVTVAGLFWTAPEILRNPLPPRNGTPKADVYSVGILLYNIIYRLPPFHTDREG